MLGGGLFDYRVSSLALALKRGRVLNNFAVKLELKLKGRLDGARPNVMCYCVIGIREA